MMAGLARKRPGLPWHQLMGVGIGLMGLDPSTFWKLSVPEFLAALDMRIPHNAGAVERTWLEEAMGLFPDQMPKEIKDA